MDPIKNPPKFGHFCHLMMLYFFLVVKIKNVDSLQIFQMHPIFISGPIFDVRFGMRNLYESEDILQLLSRTNFCNHLFVHVTSYHIMSSCHSYYCFLTKKHTKKKPVPNEFHLLENDPISPTWMPILPNKKMALKRKIKKTFKKKHTLLLGSFGRSLFFHFREKNRSELFFH